MDFWGYLRWVLVGLGVAVLLVSPVFLFMPKVEEFVVRSQEAGEGSFSASVYSVPDVEIGHYRLTDEDYFAYLVDGHLDVGRIDPSILSSWYETLYIEKAKEILLDIFKQGIAVYYSMDSEGDTTIADDIISDYLAGTVNFEATYGRLLDFMSSELDNIEVLEDHEEAMQFLAWYQAEYGDFDFSRLLSFEEFNRALVNELKADSSLREGMPQEDFTNEEIDNDSGSDVGSDEEVEGVEEGEVSDDNGNLENDVGESEVDEGTVNDEDDVDSHEDYEVEDLDSLTFNKDVSLSSRVVQL